QSGNRARPLHAIWHRSFAIQNHRGEVLAAFLCGVLQGRGTGDLSEDAGLGVVGPQCAAVSKNRLPQVATDNAGRVNAAKLDKHRRAVMTKTFAGLKTLAATLTAAGVLLASGSAWATT